MRVEVTGADALRNLTASLPADVTRAVTAHLYRDEVVPLAQDMRARAQRYGRIGARAASTITVTATADGARLEAGGTSTADLGAALFAGSEYGGRVRKKTYARKNRGSGAHPVTRRTTQMFLPHLGRRGYWFWPAMRTDLRGLIGRTAKVIDEVIDRG